MHIRTFRATIDLFLAAINPNYHSISSGDRTACTPKTQLLNVRMEADHEQLIKCEVVGKATTIPASTVVDMRKLRKNQIVLPTNFNTSIDL